MLDIKLAGAACLLLLCTLPLQIECINTDTTSQQNNNSPAPNGSTVPYDRNLASVNESASHNKTINNGSYSGSANQKDTIFHDADNDNAPILATESWADTTTSSYDETTGNVSTTTSAPGICDAPYNRTFPTVCAPCGMTEIMGCPVGSVNVSQQDCDIGYGSNLVFCLLLCQMPALKPLCCPGWWGVDCQPCPSTTTASNETAICNGQGSCSDGISGDGSCSCNDDFTGTACEMCAHDDVHGAYCNQTCECVHGACDAGHKGTGQCTCEHGYDGQRCDTQTHCLNHLCGSHAHCTDDLLDVNCTCNRGYTGDGQNCTLLDFCSEELTPCDSDAECIMNGPANYTCTCKEGYTGDGFVCFPIDHCQDVVNRACPFNSTECVYTGPGLFSCRCLPGFKNYSEDSGCVMRDLCEENRNLCHKNANCTMLGPLIHTCRCHEGFIGSGYNCYGDILHTLNELNNHDSNLRFKLNRTIQLYSFVSQNLESKRSLTVFVPLDSGLALSNQVMNNWYAASQIVRQHILPVAKSLHQLKVMRGVYTLEGNSALINYNSRRRSITYKLPGFSSRARIVKPNKLAANGVIHFVSQLLTKPPVIGHKPKQTLLPQIQSDGRFNRLESLMATAGLHDILNTTNQNLTVFAPNNKAWDTMPDGTVQYLLSRAGRGKLIALMKNHILMTPVHSFDLLDMNRVETMANNVIGVGINARGQFILNNKAKISQTDIPAVNGLYYHVTGILVPESILPILPRFCNNYTEEYVDGQCGLCTETLHCPLPTDIPDLTQEPSRCNYISRSSNVSEVPGCSRRCRRRTERKQCCPNFYGPNCNPCPGGHTSPCGGRGKCDDGLTGSGICKCHDNFTGTICDKCSDLNRFGPECAQECTCIRGECDNRVAGSEGHCRAGSCERLYGGQDCQLVSRLCGRDKHCHVYAVCRMANLTNAQLHLIASHSTLWWFVKRAYVRCHCKDGYRGDGRDCSVINRCEDADYGGCHREAVCTPVSPGQNNCTCRSGWVGDGTYCYPSTPCSDHNHCSANAQCLATIPGEYRCQCEENYHGDGINCVANNMCDYDNGGCHRWATCVPLGPGNRTCTCNLRYAGDGISCHGTLWQEIQANEQTAIFAELLRKSHLPALLSNFSKQYTVFAPNSSLLQSRGNGRIEPDLLYIRYHVIQGRYDTGQLQSLALIRSTSGHYFMPTLARSDHNDLEVNVTSTNNELLINSGPIASGNHYALNGMIHILQNDIYPLEPSANLSHLFSRHAGLSKFYQDLQRTRLFQAISEGNISEYTIFAVENNNWRLNLVEENLEGEQLKKYMSYYVLPHKFSLDDLATRRTIPTLLGQGPSSKLNITAKNGKVFVNGNMVHDDRLRTPRGNVFKLVHMLHVNLHRCDQQLLDGTIQAQCCPGYYGFDCLECPGGDGGSRPCNGHGSCNDTLTGTGRCSCLEGFTGHDCDTCEHGYKGPNCRLDMCTLCHAKAVCHTRGTNVSCFCAPGYVGDGTSCDPACQVNNGGCDENAHCSASLQTGDISCRCEQDFHGTGLNCTRIVDLCLDDNGGCSQSANCTFNPPEADSTSNGFVRCTCKEGFTGNGTLCNGDLLSTLRSMNETQDFYNAITQIMGMDNSYATMIKAWFDQSGDNRTIFAPINWIVMNSTESEVLDIERHIVEDYIRFDETFEVNHTTYLALSGDNITIQIPTRQAYFTVNGTSIILPNIPSINGIIHLIENPLEEKVPTETLPVRSSPSMTWTPYIIGGLLVIIVIVIVIALIIAKRKSNWPRFNRSQDTDSEFTFKILNSFDPTEPTSEEMLDASSVFKNPLYDRLVDTS